MDELREEIEGTLRNYLNSSVDSSTVTVMSNRALLAYKEYMNYPSTWTADKILADMTAHMSCIIDLALFDCVQQGAEFQSMHIESGLYRMWHSKGNVYTQHHVVPFATT